jgi:hypothetical protein
VYDALTGSLLRTFNDPTIATEGTNTDNFGFSVTLDGNNVLIGEHADDTLGGDVGQAHLFTLPTGDYDGDGDADGFDFLKWQPGESPNPLSALDLTYWEANLGVPVSGDFDGDGDVDGFDFLKWQRVETPGLGSAEELALWESQFGTTVPPLSALAVATPEPSSILLAVLAGLLFCSRRR